MYLKWVMSCYFQQLNSKNNRPGLLFQTTFCFLSSVSTIGKDVFGLKLSFDAMPAKITRKVLSLVLSDEICSIYIFLHHSKGAFCVWLKVLSNKVSSELT